MNQDIINLKNQFAEITRAKGKSKIPLIKTFATNPMFNNELFLKTYEFVFSPFITTGLAKKKMQKDLGAEPYYNPNNTLLHMFEYIKQHNSGSDAVIKSVQSWILGQPEETHEFLTNVFINDLTIGASEKALNEALGYEYIPVHEIMLAKRWEKEQHKIKDDEKFFITLKMDDYRTTCIYDEVEGRWKLKARSGLEFEGVVEIEAILNQLPSDMVYDGGLISVDDTLKAKDRFRATGKILKTEGPKKGLMFYIYDMIPLKEFITGKSKLNYEERQKDIIKLLNYFDDGQFNKLFLPVEKLYEGTDKEAVFPILEKVLEEEYEGLMVNTAKGKYEPKRTDQLLKVKEFYNVDLRVIDSYEYKHPNKLGGFICEYKDGNTVRVGGGFKLKEREEWWPKRDEFVGKIIEVRYFQESKNQNGGKSIRHGHFVGVRWDKNEPSYH